jgi:type VI secretion system protein ImpJ
MRPKQRVVWVEGMLMEPQHFQQQERFFEHLLTQRIASVSPYAWGFFTLEIDNGLLRQGKLALKRARGVFADGTPFDMPDHDPLPEPLLLEGDLTGAVLHLAVEMDLPGSAHVDFSSGVQRTGRFLPCDAEIADSNAGINSEGAGRRALLQLGNLNCRLVMASALSTAESSLAVAVIREVLPDGRIQLDEKILPPLLDFRAVGWLPGSTSELLGFINQRLDAVSRPDVHLATGGLSELLELLLLQTLSEYRLKLHHLLTSAQVHPERLFDTLLGLLGRLCIVPGAEQSQQRSELHYQHNQLHDSYFPLFAALRRALSLVIEAPAVALNFVEHGENLYLCQNDVQWRLEKLVFAISCALPADLMRSYFPAQTKLASAEKIVQLIDLQLPGARLMPMAAPPRYIPYYPNSLYFEVDASDPLFREMMSGAAFALSIVGDFPELRFDAWGLRQGRVA